MQSTKDYLPLLLDELKLFVSDMEEVGVSEGDRTYFNSEEDAYTKSPGYQVYITGFHQDPYVIDFIDIILHNTTDEFCIVDVGCGSGFTGLSLALAGRKVTFHDYDGIGLNFIRYFINKHNLTNCSVIEYNEEISKHDVAIALDVIEHTGSHIGSLRWLSELGNTVAITYPLMPWTPPYTNNIDQHVDDEIMFYALQKRYALKLWHIENDRRYAIYTERE